MLSARRGWQFAWAAALVSILGVATAAVVAAGTELCSASPKSLEAGLSNTMRLQVCSITFAVCGEEAVTPAAAGSIMRTVPVGIDSGPADVIYMDVSPDMIANCGGGTAVVTATLRDASGNLVEDGTPVLFGSTYGYVSLYPYSGFTHNGVLTTTVIADQHKPISLADWPLGLEQVYAYSGSAAPALRNLWIRSGVPSQIALSVDPAEIHILGDVNSYDIISGAEAMDCSGTPVEDGTNIMLRTTKGYFRESGQSWWEPTTVGGLVTATLTSREIVGNVVITATAGSAVGTADAYFIPDPPAYVTVWAVPPAIPADGRSRTTVWGEIKDGFNNLVGPGITVTFTTARGQFVSGGNSCTAYTTLDGLASCELVSDTTPGTVIVIAETYNGVSGWFDLAFIGLPAATPTATASPSATLTPGPTGGPPPRAYLPMLRKLVLDCAEPANNIRVGACGPLVSGRTYRDFISSASDEHDWFYFDMPVQHTVDAWLREIPAGCNYDLLLRDSQGGPITSSAQDKPEGEHIVWGPLSPGRYYLVVEQIRGWNASVPYALHVDFQ
jgi:hypothetical protein